MASTIPTETQTAELAHALERVITEHTWGQVRRLQVEVKGSGLVVHGIVRSYYVKQLAIQAIVAFLEERESQDRPDVFMDVEVDKDA